MQGKNIAKTVIIVLLVLWSLYALWPSYKFFSLSPENKRTLEDEGKLVPLIDKSIRMGLDLQGGMYLTLEVDLPKLIEQQVRNKDDRFDAILQKTQEEMNVSSEEFLSILSRNFEEEGIPLNRYWGERGDSDGKVLSELEKEANDAIDRSLRILENRIDEFGVSEPHISKMGSRRILIQLPGISDPEQARNLIGQTALLEFKMLKDPTVFSETIQKIDRALARERGAKIEEPTAEAEKDTSQQETTPKESQDKVISVSELFGDEAVTQDETATSDTSLLVDEQTFKENPFIALLRSSGQQGREVTVPVENVKAVDRILEKENIRTLIPTDGQFLWGSETFRIADKSYRSLYLVKREPELTGRYLTDATVNISSDAQYAGRPEVHFTLDRSGSRIFSRVTGANINKFMAIVLDDKVVSAPRIESKIPQGRSRITGIPNMDEAKMLSIVLRAGALPAPVQIVEERTVGPSLGRDSINQGGLSALIGMSIVVLFMIFYYRMSGFIADVALILNLVLLLAVLAQFRFVLTLPGIAGIVLTIGMAVDANVLVFERIREELRTGKTVRASIDAGYARAFRTIMDANLTTLLTALVLYQFGTGPIRGFAITLSIGIVVSMFTALVVTRVIFDNITSKRTLVKLSI
ncbi:MAG: protein translocase subunit SecD [bacterium]